MVTFLAHSGDAEALAAIGGHDVELALYREFSSSYSCDFYILKR